MKTEIKKIFKIIQENLECESFLSDKAIDEATDKIYSLISQEAEKIEDAVAYIKSKVKECDEMLIEAEKEDNKNKEVVHSVIKYELEQFLSILNKQEEFDVRKWLEEKSRGKPLVFQYQLELKEITRIKGYRFILENMNHNYRTLTITTGDYKQSILYCGTAKFTSRFIFEQLLKLLNIEL